jgi:hypothetical protein
MVESVPVKLKTLTLLKSVIGEGSPNVIVCCQAMLAEQVAAMESFTCAPDPQVRHCAALQTRGQHLCRCEMLMFSTETNLQLWCRRMRQM